MALFQACKQVPRSIAVNHTVIRSLASDSVSSSKKETDIVAPAQDVMVADVISGAPGANLHYFTLENGLLIISIGELRHRAVRIYQPTRNTMQSGGSKGERWRIDFDILQGGGRWENPLMGWASS